ncbi:MAG: hypothetical protein GX640_19565, partial [Fibrobacter sp.]|nr:hypothetical protein [Fibrobacter sp.]
NLYGRGTPTSHFRSSDKPRGGIRYEFGRIQLETAIDYLKTGPTVYHPVTLSGATPPLTFFRGTLDMNVMNYTHVVGLLKEQKDRSKYIYVHRLGSKLWKSRLDFGINEVIVTGDLVDEPHGPFDKLQMIVPPQRNWEWAYFIPFLPFKFLEQFSGDRDNAIITFDVNLNYPKKFRWYLEFLIDDILDPQYFFTDDWGNKWALTAGVQHFGTFLNRNITIDFEYSRVEPWVYTHFYGGSHRYTHFGQSLGSVLGPNSQAFVLNSTYNLNRLHTVGIGLSSIAKNDSTRGSHITDIFQFPDPNDSSGFTDIPKKRFMGPGTKWSLKPSVTWCFNPYGLFSLNAKYEIDLLENRGRSNLSLWGGVSF